MLKTVPAANSVEVPRGLASTPMDRGLAICANRLTDLVGHHPLSAIFACRVDSSSHELSRSMPEIQSVLQHPLVRAMRADFFLQPLPRVTVLQNCKIVNQHVELLQEERCPAARGLLERMYPGYVGDSSRAGVSHPDPFH